MRYMLLIYSEESVWSEDERQRCFAESANLAMRLHGDGKCIAPRLYTRSPSLPAYRSGMAKST